MLTSPEAGLPLVAGATGLPVRPAPPQAAPSPSMVPSARPADATPSIPLASPSAGMVPSARPADATPSIPLAGAQALGQPSAGIASPSLNTPRPPAPSPDTMQAAMTAQNAAPAAPAASSPIPLAGSSTAAPYANAATNTPGGATDYTNKTITPGAGVDRMALANQEFESSAKASDPYYQKTLRDATSAAGANGQLGSGMERTSLGDAANLRNTQLDALRSNLMNTATEGTIGDQYKNIGIAQQQQGFQSGQQNTAFNQATQQAQLEEALRSGDFSRAATMLGMGNAGNPSDTALTLANSYGNQAGAAGAAVSNLVGNSVRNANTQVPDWMQQYLNGGAGNTSSGAPTSTPDYTTGLPPIAQTPSAPNPQPWNYGGPVTQPAYPGALPLAGAS
jgi:hypothetical protein